MANVQVQVKKQKRCTSEELNELTKEELIEKLQALEAQNTQLKSLLSKTLQDKKGSVASRNKKPFDFTKCTFRHILLNFFYLGWDYQGFATQEDTNNTIEFHLFEALTKTCLIPERSQANYHRCGRTDKGVSAFGQVISLDIRSKLSKENQHEVNEELDYCKMLNKVLPENIQCIGWRPATENYSSRFDCKSRTYKYFFPKGTLNIEKMQTAAGYLVGAHDFRNFCKMDVGNGVVQFIRNIFSIDIQPTNISDVNSKENEPYQMQVVVIKAQSFLWHQIRCIMGILFLIGEEKEEPKVVLELLDVEKNPRKPEYNMASEIPLNLYYCEYGFCDINNSLASCVNDDNYTFKDHNAWKYDQEGLEIVLGKLRTAWTFSSIKTSMMKNMIEDLEILSAEKLKPSMSDSLLNGVKSKKYVPLMQRKRCESLENRIQHYVKRSRIEIVTTEN